MSRALCKWRKKLLNDVSLAYPQSPLFSRYLLTKCVDKEWYICMEAPPKPRQFASPLESLSMEKIMIAHIIFNPFKYSCELYTPNEPSFEKCSQMFSPASFSCHPSHCTGEGGKRHAIISLGRGRWVENRTKYLREVEVLSRYWHFLVKKQLIHIKQKYIYTLKGTTHKIHVWHIYLRLPQEVAKCW